MNDLTNSRGDAVEQIPTLLAQYAQVQRDLAALATNPVILEWRDAEKAKTNLEAAIKEEAHKGTESVRGFGYVVKVTPRTSINWLPEILLERLPWLGQSGHITVTTSYSADKKKLEKLLIDRSIDDDIKAVVRACRTEEPLTPAVSIQIDAESLLALPDAAVAK